MWQRLRRIWRHRWIDEGDLQRALPADLAMRLGQRVAASERRHTGEIRIHAEAGLPWSYLWRDAAPRERAIMLFGKLRVWDTEDNNGVLIYLLLAEHAIEIVADRGLARRVSPARWQAIVAGLGEALRAGRFEEGLARAVEEVTSLLEAHFPASHHAPNPNELPDAPTMG